LSPGWIFWLYSLAAFLTFCSDSKRQKRVRPSLCENILFKLFGHKSALTLFHLSYSNLFLLYLISNIGVHKDFTKITRVVISFLVTLVKSLCTSWFILTEFSIIVQSVGSYSAYLVTVKFSDSFLIPGITDFLLTKLPCAPLLINKP